MGLFSRKKAAGPQGGETIVYATTGGRLPDNQVPGTFQVAVVGPRLAAGEPSLSGGDTALVSGLLLGAFPVFLVQVTVTAPQATWPHPGDELAAAVDPANPLNFVVQWATVPGHDDTPAPTGPPTSGWDPGPDGTHSAAMADWLAERGFTAGDFGPLLESAAPGMTALLDVAAGRYATVIRGAAAVALMTNGQPAQGVVLKTEKLPIPPQMLPSPDACLAWLTLRVQPSDTAGAGSSGRAGTGASDSAGTGYETTIRFGFRSPERFSALATVGTELPLRVDPTDPAKVTLDLPALGITPQ